MVRDAAHAYAQDKLAPRILEAFRHEKTDSSIFREMGELGVLGATLPSEYGGHALNYVCYGLIAREIERVDSGYRSMMSVQSSLVKLRHGADARGYLDDWPHHVAEAASTWPGVGSTVPGFTAETDAIAAFTRAKRPSSHTSNHT